jgi:hypothetical protein
MATDAPIAAVLSIAPALERMNAVRKSRMAHLSLISLLLVTAVMVACVMVVGCRRAPAGPATPEELAIAVFGAGRPDTQDPGVYQVEVDASGRLRVMCRFAVLTPDALSQCRAKLVELFREGFKFENVDSIYVQMDFPFRDKAGNMTLEKGLVVSLSRVRNSQIDWAVFNARDLPNVCDEWWVDPRVQ